MKKYLIIIWIAITATQVQAQQDVMVSQYMFNGLFLNPAYAGSHKYVSSSLLHRTQWLGFSGAPKTMLFAVDGLAPTAAKNMGLGLIVSNDRIGSTEQTDIYANYSYQLRLGKGKLSFGLKAGVSNYVFKSNNLLVWDSNDELFAGKRSVWLPKFGAGAYYFCEKWYAGISIPTLLAYDAGHNFGFDVNQNTFLNRHYYLTGGYVFTLNDEFKLKPSALIKYLPAAPLQVDLNLNVLYKDMIWLGASYRTGDAVTAMVEYQTNTRFRVGYAYDFTTSKIRNYSSGTHEIMIGYDFGKDIVKIKTPRYF
ncbi:MAG: type IX secretion system membrane protein PorP/SprF [Bacteroidetes bacterium]|nr:type IX secretion system membrane protein PorP/SprF [Bacteroidota bacterium]